MPRVKKLNLVLQYGDTDYYVNDLGVEKSPRFELYNTADKKVIAKSDNPVDFDNWIKKNIWKGYNFECETESSDKR